MAEEMDGLNVKVFVCVATEYGRELLPQTDHITVLTGRLDEPQMCNFMNEHRFDCVVDATHPYAVEVTENIMRACHETHTTYFRLMRESSESEACISVSDTHAAADFLSQTEGTVLLTTGSKELGIFTKVENYRERLYARVLPIPQVLQKCFDLGFEGSHLIAMQGPFSRQMNLALMKQWNIKIMVTKDSGRAGGFSEKLRAAKLARVQTLVIGRPQEQVGYRYKELLKLLTNQYHMEKTSREVCRIENEGVSDRNRHG